MTTPMLFYVAPSWKRASIRYSPLMYPFWGNPLTEKTPFQKALFDQHGFDTAAYGITDDIKAAEAVLMPYSHRIALLEQPGLFEECKRTAHENGKKLFVDGVSDIEIPIPEPFVYVLRYGGYRFLKQSNEIHIQPYAEDLLEELGLAEVPERALSKGKPTIGFAGRAALPLGQHVRAKIKDIPATLRSFVDSRYGAMRKGVFFRAEAMDVLARDARIDTRFTSRSSYSANTETMEKSPEALRRDFIENFLDVDYCLDVRGDANAATRLPEMLSLGRIPVILDTERNFAFDDELDYSSFGLVVDFREMHLLPEKLLAFHAGLTQESYRAMQLKARDAYLKFMRVDALMVHIVERLRRAI